MSRTSSVVEEVTERFQGVFGGFYAPWISQAERALADASGTVPEVAAVIDDVLGDLMGSLVATGSRTLIASAHAAAAEDDFATVAGRVSSPAGRQEILDVHPVLRRLLDQQTEQTITAILEMVARYDADRSQLSRLGFAAGSRLLGVDISAGDQHANGRRVLILRTDAGRLVYKPRPLDIDLLVIGLADLVAEDLGRRRIRLPRTEARGDYGWQEFIEARASSDEAEYREYYRNLGATLAFFTALGGHDLHYENVIGVGEAPVVVDLETALRVRDRMPRGDTLADAVARDAWYGPGGTLILPNLGGAERFDIDLSVAGTALEQRSEVMTSGMLTGAGTRDISIEQMPAVIRRVLQAPADLEPQLMFPDLSADLRDGYGEAAPILRRHLPVLRTRVALARGEFREILRPTSTYAAFLEAATHPRYLGSEEERARLFALLGTPVTVPEDIAEVVGRAETAALERGDVPYFCYRPSRRELREACGSPLSVSEEGRDLAAIDALDAFAERGLHKDLHLIEGLAACASDNVWQTRRAPEQRSTLFPVVADTPDAAALSMADQMLELAVWSPDRAEATIISTHLREDDRGLRLAPADLTLYQGAGPAMLLAAAAASTGDVRYRDGLRALLEPFLVSPLPEPATFSAYTGAASMWRALAAADEVLDDERIRDAQRQVLDHAVDLLHAEDASRDVISGVSGLLPVLAAADHGSGRYAAAIERAADLAQRWVPEAPRERLAHGRLGALVGLAAVAESVEIDSERIAAEILTEVRAALEQPVDAPGVSSWCKGGAGALIGAAEALPMLGFAVGDLDEAVGDAARDWFGRVRFTSDASLCHGSAGVLVAASRLGRALDDTGLDRWSQEAALRILSDGARDGYTGGIAHAQNSLGYFLGMPGFAHALLYVARPLSGHLVPLLGGRPVVEVAS